MIPIEVLLNLPWTVRRSEENIEGERSIELSVAELDGFAVYGENEAEAEERFWSGLRLFLESFIEEGATPPLPDSVRAIKVGQGRTDEDAACQDCPLDVTDLPGYQPGRIGMTNLVNSGELTHV